MYVKIVIKTVSRLYTVCTCFGFMVYVCSLTCTCISVPHLTHTHTPTHHRNQDPSLPQPVCLLASTSVSYLYYRTFKKWTAVSITSYLRTLKITLVLYISNSVSFVQWMFWYKYACDCLWPPYCCIKFFFRGGWVSN